MNSLFKKKIKSTIYIDGMNCNHCAAKVTNALSDLGLSAKIDLAKKCAIVKSSEPLNEKEIFDSISQVGFTPVKIEN